MRSIDIHAHLMPQCLWRAFEEGREWYGIHHEPGDGLGMAVSDVRRVAIPPKLRFTPEERLQDMDDQGVEMQVVSIHTPLFSYHLEAEQGRQLARVVDFKSREPDPGRKRGHLVEKPGGLAGSINRCISRMTLY